MLSPQMQMSLSLVPKTKAHLLLIRSLQKQGTGLLAQSRSQNGPLRWNLVMEKQFTRHSDENYFKWGSFSLFNHALRCLYACVMAI